MKTFNSQKPRVWICFGPNGIDQVVFDASDISQELGSLQIYTKIRRALKNVDVLLRNRNGV